MTDTHAATDDTADAATASYLDGNSYLKDGHDAKAIAAYDHALQLHPQFPKAYNNRGVAYLDLQDYDQAIADFSHAVQLDPTMAQAYYNRGRSYFFENNFQQAASDFGQAIQLKPDYADAYNNRGTAYVQTKDYAHAYDDFRRAVQLHPDDKLAQQNLADVKMKLRLRDMSAAASSPAPLPPEPLPVQAPPQQGAPDGEKGGYAKAIADCNHAIHLNPHNAAAYNDRATAYAAMGDFDEALADYTTAISLQKANGHADRRIAPFYYNRGLCYEDKGDHAQAIADYTSALQIDSHLLGAHNNLAWTLATCPQPNLRDGKRAVAEATRACELSGWKNTAYWDTLAAASAESGDFPGAVKWQAKCLESPSLPANEKAGAQARLALYQVHQPYHESQ